MAVGTQQFQIILTVVSTVAIFMMDFQRNFVGVRIHFAPSTFRARGVVFLKKIAADMIAYIERTNDAADVSVLPLLHVNRMLKFNLTFVAAIDVRGLTTLVSAVFAFSSWFFGIQFQTSLRI